ncbi:MAG TPA: hypothetical protein VFU69_15875 [Ktedonobacterales bacterium]|nr:hypothetical protein [Ktedonobacterales bacterium]
MRNPKAYVGAPILQKRFGRYTFRIDRFRKVKPIVLGDGWERIHSVLRSPPPFQQRLGRIFPSFQHQMPPMDARHVITLEMPFPRGKIGIDIYQHPAH